MSVLKVQIGAFRNAPGKDFFKGIEVDSITLPNGLIRYTTGEFLYMFEADVLKDSIAKLGFPDAFIATESKYMTIEEFNKMNQSEVTAEDLYGDLDSIPNLRTVDGSHPIKDSLDVDTLLNNLDLGIDSLDLNDSTMNDLIDVPIEPAKQIDTIYVFVKWHKYIELYNEEEELSDAKETAEVTYTLHLKKFNVGYYEEVREFKELRKLDYPRMNSGDVIYYSGKFLFKENAEKIRMVLLDYGFQTIEVKEMHK